MSRQRRKQSVSRLRCLRRRSWRIIWALGVLLPGGVATPAVAGIAATRDAIRRNHLSHQPYSARWPSAVDELPTPSDTIDPRTNQPFPYAPNRNDRFPNLQGRVGPVAIVTLT
jgi:anti-sigma factor RsiW